MLLSRGAALARSALLKPGKNKPVHLVKTAARNSSGEGCTYRMMGDPPGSESISRWADAGYIVFWTWVCYHSITKYEHIIGEYDYPDPLAWTDEELGVPPDDYEPPSRH